MKDKITINNNNNNVKEDLCWLGQGKDLQDWGFKGVEDKVVTYKGKRTV